MVFAANGFGHVDELDTDLAFHGLKDRRNQIVKAAGVAGTEIENTVGLFVIVNTRAGHVGRNKR